ncbi:MAG: DUF551 domain-containing protein [Clostridia bacterium]|nr:DUF551 domain-containing protein [Clostridia bacterium]
MSNTDRIIDRGISTPNWISVEDALPTEDDNYITLSEAQQDFEHIKKGDIYVDDCNSWEDGKWYDDGGGYWKILYWAYPVRVTVPAHLADRPKYGAP